MSRVVFWSLANSITEPADGASAGSSASFGLDFVWENNPPREDADDKLLSPSSDVKQQDAGQVCGKIRHFCGGEALWNYAHHLSGMGEAI